MQLVANDGHVGPLRGELAPRLTQHRLAKAVVLPDQVRTAHALVGAQHLHQRRHAHVGMGIEAEMPEAALFVGELGVDGRVVQKQHTPGTVTLVVLGNSVQQRCRRGRGIALQHDTRAIVDGGAQRRQRLLARPLAVVARQRQGAGTARQHDAAARVHPLGGPQQVAVHRLTGVGEWPGQALDQRQLHGRSRLRQGRGRAAT